jgi:hypothetical protein
VLLHPRRGGMDPLLWRDWPRRAQRRACMHLLRSQRVDMTEPTTAQPRSPTHVPQRRLLCSPVPSGRTIASPRPGAAGAQ